MTCQATYCIDTCIRGPRSVKERPGVGAVETLDNHGLQQSWIEVAQVDAMPCPRSRVERLPVRDNAAGLAADIPEGPIAPDVLLGVFRVARDGDCSKRVVAKDRARAAAQRTVAARRLLRRARQRQPHGPAMA
jgi:hypothetical protein